MDINSVSPVASYHLHTAQQPSSATPGVNDTSANNNGRTHQSGHEQRSSGVDKSDRQLSEPEQREVRELQQRDREVRAHEAAHKAAAGRYATSGPSYDYQRGPDGRQYAVGGEVSIDTSKPEDPAEALRKAQTIQAAALAPAEPSAQDRKVAQEAVKMAADARSEMARQSAEEAGQAMPRSREDHYAVGSGSAAAPGSVLDAFV